MIHLEFEVPMDLEADILVRAAESTLAHEAVGEGDLTLMVSGDEQLRALNLEFRGLDAATDVLSFPSEEVDPETGVRYLGDVIFSLARVVEQAEGRGHLPVLEMQLLVVHGVLHLLGYDHADAEEKARMWQAQGEILVGLGVPLAVMPE